MYSNSDPYSNYAALQEYNTFKQTFMVFALGSAVFAFVGICALFCCWRKRYRGMESKGHVVREAEPRVPLIQPTSVVNNPVMMPGSHPVQAPQFAPAIPNPHDQSPYDQQPQAPPPL